MATVYAGSSGWAYPSWKSAFYPAKLASGKFLQHYATRLNTVEVNYTFRHFATEKTLNNWIACTPPEFRFSIKAHQNITHVRRLKDASEYARGFLSSLQPLVGAERIGMVLFQLPPFLKADAALLDGFLGGLPHAARFSFEFRHQSWFTDQTFEILRKYNSALCVAESEKLESPDLATADFGYYRLRKPEYSPKELEEISKRALNHLNSGHDVFLYFKHEETPEGVLYAEKLLAAIRAQQAGS
jgi:uncharacterized protein YecE (DUF72 family)